jgi:hypothetical protein
MTIMKKEVPLKVRLILVLLMISALSLAPVANADIVVISGTMEGDITIDPGDTIQAGYDFMVPGNHAATTITVTGSVVVKVLCPNNSTQNITINFPAASYAVTANNDNWFPANQNVYEASTVAPSTLCGGKPGQTPNGATYTGTFSSTANCITANARFHYSDKSPGTWSSPTGCLSSEKCISGPCKCS